MAADPTAESLSALLDLGGKAALVTGGAQGFGYACASRLAEAGAGIVLADLQSDRLEAARDRLAATGASVVAVSGDISIESDVRRLVGAAVESFGRLDILVNNAGVFSNFLLEHMHVDEFQRILDVNIRGTFLCIQAAAE